MSNLHYKGCLRTFSHGFTNFIEFIDHVKKKNPSKLTKSQYWPHDAANIHLRGGIPDGPADGPMDGLMERPTDRQTL